MLSESVNLLIRVFDDLLQNFKIAIVSQGADRIEFDMIGIDASIANTLRRILIAEVGMECC